MGEPRQLVYGPAGVKSYVDQDELDKLGKGYRVATPEEAREDELQRQYGSWDAQLASGAMGAVRGLSAGVSDKLLVGGAELIGGEDAAASMRRSLNTAIEANPGASAVGDVAGTVGALLLSGGTAAGARGAGMTALRGVSAPTRAIIRGGELAEQAITGGYGLAERAIGRGLAGRALVPQIGRAAVEGAGFELGQYLSESALGNEQVTAEKLLAAAKHGALLGGGLATGLGIGAGALREGKDRIARALLKPSEEAGQSLMQKAFGYGTDAVATVQSLATGLPRETAAKLLAPGRAGREARRIAFRDGMAIREKAAREFAEDLTGRYDDSSYLRKHFVEEGKPGQFSHLVDQKLYGRQAQKSAELFGEVDATLEMLAARPGQYGKSLQKDLRAIFDEQYGKLREAIDSGNSSAMWTHVETMKRELDETTKGLLGAKGTKWRRSARAARKLEEVSDKLRANLEDAATWGEASLLQHDMNRAIHEGIGHGGQLSKLTVKMGNDLHRTFAERIQADTKRVDDWFAQLANPKGDTTRQAFNAVSQTDERVASALLKHLGPKMTAEQRTVMKRIVERSKRMRNRFGDVEETIATVAQGEAAIAADSQGSIVEGLTGGGIASGDPLVLAAAPLLGIATQPGLTARRLAALEQIAGGIDARLRSTVGRLVDRGESATGSRLVAAARLGVVGDATRDDYRDAVARRQAVATESRRLAAATPEALRQRLDGWAGDLRSVAPGVLDAAATAAERRVAVLRALVPDPGPPTHLLGPDPDATETELARWEDVRPILDEPARILDSLEDGTITGAQVDALRAAFPAYYADARERVLAKLAAARADGRIPEWRDVVALSTFTGTPLDPLLEPGTVADLQDAWGAPPPTGQAAGKQRPGGPPPKLPASMATGTAELERDNES